MTVLNDVFGRQPQVGDYIAAAMGYGQSSVLRVGKILDIQTKDNKKYGVKVEWRNWTSSEPYNGRIPRWSYSNKRSSILYVEGDYSFSKYVILPAEFVEQFPANEYE